RPDDVLGIAGGVQPDARSRPHAAGPQRFGSRDDRLAQGAVRQSAFRPRSEDRRRFRLAGGRFAKSFVQVRHEFVARLSLHAAAALPTAGPIAQQAPTTRADAWAQRSAERHLPTIQKLSSGPIWSEARGIS